MSDDPVGDAIRAARYADAIMRRTEDQDPFDPRLLGASLRLAANEDLLGQLHDEFHDWYAEHGNERLNWAGRGPLGNWHQIENFLKDRYPEAHKGITTGKEEAGSLLDTGQLGPDGDYCPKCHGRGFHLLRTNEACPACDGSGKPDQPMAYATGQDAVDRLGYDPKEIAAGMLLLHNRTHSERSDLEQGDNDRLSEIARMRSQMQPRIGTSRTASIYDWKPYTPALVQELRDNNLWDGTGVDQRSWETRSDAGDHYYVRPAGSVVNTLDHDHPQKHTGDPNHWEVEHLPPEYGHDPEGYFGDIHGPTALNRWAHPVEGTHPHGFSSAEEAMDWVKARHPEEGFDPDGAQDPFDPRLIGAQRRTAGMFDWKQQYAKPDLSWTAKTETGHAVRLLSPEAHWGAGREVEDRDANGVSDMGWSWQIHHLGDLTDEQPHPTVMNAASLGGKIHALDRDTDPRVYSGEYLPTREHAERQLEQAYTELARRSGGQPTSHDYDIDSIMRGQDHLGPTPPSGPGDDEDYGHIFGMLRRLGMTLDPADIIRLAGDGMSWEDTMAHIDQVLGEGEKGSAQSDFLDAYYTSGPGAGTQPRDLIPLRHDENYCPDCERNVAEEGHEPGFLCAEGDDCTH